MIPSGNRGTRPPHPSLGAAVRHGNENEEENSFPRRQQLSPIQECSIEDDADTDADADTETHSSFLSTKKPTLKRSSCAANKKSVTIANDASNSGNDDSNSSGFNGAPTVKKKPFGTTAVNSKSLPKQRPTSASSAKAATKPSPNATTKRKSVSQPDVTRPSKKQRGTTSTFSATTDSHPFQVDMNNPKGHDRITFGNTDCGGNVTHKRRQHQGANSLVYLNSSASTNNDPKPDRQPLFQGTTMCVQASADGSNSASKNGDPDHSTEDTGSAVSREAAEEPTEDDVDQWMEELGEGDNKASNHLVNTDAEAAEESTGTKDTNTATDSVKTSTKAVNANAEAASNRSVTTSKEGLVQGSTGTKTSAEAAADDWTEANFDVDQCLEELGADKLEAVPDDWANDLAKADFDVDQCLEELGADKLEAVPEDEDTLEAVVVSDGEPTDENLAVAVPVLPVDLNKDEELPVVANEELAAAATTTTMDDEETVAEDDSLGFPVAEDDDILPTGDEQREQLEAEQRVEAARLQEEQQEQARLAQERLQLKEQEARECLQQEQERVETARLQEEQREQARLAQARRDAEELQRQLANGDDDEDEMERKQALLKQRLESRLALLEQQLSLRQHHLSDDELSQLEIKRDHCKTELRKLAENGFRVFSTKKNHPNALPVDYPPPWHLTDAENPVKDYFLMHNHGVCTCYRTPGMNCAANAVSMATGEKNFVKVEHLKNTHNLNVHNPRQAKEEFVKTLGMAARALRSLEAQRHSMRNVSDKTKNRKKEVENRLKNKEIIESFHKLFQRRLGIYVASVLVKRYASGVGMWHAIVVNATAGVILDGNNLEAITLDEGDRELEANELSTKIKKELGYHQLGDVYLMMVKKSDIDKGNVPHFV